MNKNYLDLERIKYESLSSYDQSLMISIEFIENLFNSLVEKDPYNDKIIWSMLDEVMLKASLINENNGLDEISQIIDYIKASLKKIIKSPKEKLVKVDIMQRFSKVQKINNKTMKWLGSQPGETLNEKIGVKGKVLAPINKHSLDKKENRIILYFFKKIEEILEIRYLGLKKQTKDMPEKFMKVYKEFSKIKRDMNRNGLYYLPMPVNFTPNNILIDHRNYSVVYRGFKKYKKYIESHNSREEKILKRSISLIGLKVYSKLNNLEGVNLINEDVELTNLFDEEFTIIPENKINFFVEDKQTKKIWIINSDIDIKNNTLKYKFDECGFKNNTKKINQQNKFNINLSFELLTDKNFELNRGLKVKCKLFNYDFTLDNQGFYEIIDKITKYITLTIKLNYSKKKNAETNIILNDIFFNFTSYIPRLNNVDLVNSLFYNKRKKFLKNTTFLNANNYKIENLYNVLDENKFIRGDFSDYLKNLVENYDLKSNILYPIPELLDEGIQSILTNSFNLNTKDSFPIWRSILATSSLDEKWFRKKESLLVLDLNTFEPSVNIIKNYGDLLEHHPPIYLEMDDLKLTIENFLKEYLEEYSNKYKLLLTYKEKDFILSSQKLYKVLFKCSRNKIKEVIIRDNGLFYLEKDDSIIIKLQNNINKNLNKLFNENEELQNIKQQYSGIIFIGDHLDFKLKNMPKNKIRSINENKLFDGFKVINDKIKQNKVTWKEFLPNLSMEISKDGHFYDFKLLKNKSGELKLGQEMKFKVKEKLILPTDSKKINFPVHTDNYNNKKEYNIQVKSKYFPLQEPMEVNLEIIYSYGGKTPYMLKIIPCDHQFKSNNLEVTWVKDENIIEFKKPKFPEIKNYDKNRILNLLNQLNDDFIKIKPAVSDIYFKEQCEKFGNRLSSQKNVLRGLVIQEISNESYILDELYSNDFIKKLIELCNIKNEEYKKFKIKLDKRDRTSIRNFIYQIQLFLTAFGSIALKDLNLNENSRDQLKYRSLLFSTKYNMFEEVLALFESKNDKTLISGIALNVWLDEYFIKNLAKNKPEILKKSLKYIIKELFYLNKNFDEKIEIPKSKLWSVTNIFRDSLEVILALLRIEDKKLLITQIGLTPIVVKKLIRLVKEIDRKVQFKDEKVKEMFDENNRLLFNINKPDALKNMSNLAYVTYLHLTGNEGADMVSIEVKEEE